MSAQRPADREAALELLRSQHVFPGPYVFRIVVHPPAAAGIVSGVGAALGSAGHVHKVVEQASRSGRYVSLRMHCELASAETILEVYELLKKLDGVVMTL